MANRKHLHGPLLCQGHAHQWIVARNIKDVQGPCSPFGTWLNGYGEARNCEVAAGIWPSDVVKASARVDST